MSTASSTDKAINLGLSIGGIILGGSYLAACMACTTMGTGLLITVNSSSNNEKALSVASKCSKFGDYLNHSGLAMCAIGLGIWAPTYVFKMYRWGKLSNL